MPDRDQIDKADRAQEAIRLTSYMMHRHYCDNDVESVIELFDEDIHWIGCGEAEYAMGRQSLSDIFRGFDGQVPKCIIEDEQYQALEISDDSYLCTGRLWISTDPSTGVYIRVHQRVSMIFRWRGEKPLCCHIHISNPYIEMQEDDVGFPTAMAQQTRDYMQEIVEKQKRQITAQAAELDSIYNTVPCFIIRILRTSEGCRLLTFNKALSELLGLSDEDMRSLDWSEGIAPFVYNDDRRRILAALQKLSMPGDFNYVDYRVKCRDGRLMYLNCSNSLISEDENGAVIQRIAFDITKRIELENILTQMSFEDALTGLLNRNRLNYDIKNSELHTEGLTAVVCIDINGLKHINDTRGHIAGDELIRRTGDMLLSSFKGRVYRMGGDEFVVVKEMADEAEFQRELRLLLQTAEREDISISIGYTC